MAWRWGWHRGSFGIVVSGVTSLRLCAVVKQQVHELVAEAVGLGARRMVSQPLARPLLSVVVPPGDAQHLGQASGWRFTLRAAAMAWVTPSGS